jgi:hypothetical protein
LLAATLCAGFVRGEDPPRAKDQREYELVQTALGERDPAKRLETLAAWTREYHETALDQMRTRLYLQTYREAGRNRDAVQAAERVLSFAPNDFAARYTLASLGPVLGDTDAAALERAQASARALLDGGIADQFDAAKRPESVSAAAWSQAETQTSAACHRTLGWVATQRKQHTEAEERFREALQAEPASAQTSYWLAQSVLAQRDPAKNELAFFALARAASLTGPGELPADSREKIRAYLVRTYEAFAGTRDGLEEIERLAAVSALPPADMPRVLSAQERKILEEKRFCEERPLECAYRKLRAALEAEDGATVWADLKGKISPRVRLYVVRNEPPDRPLELGLATTKGGPEEVALRLENRLRQAMPKGQALTIEGVAVELRREPFLLTLSDGKILP